MATSFSTDLLPLFRSIDVNHMKPHGVRLDDYQYMSDATGDNGYPDHANARKAYSALAMNRMPPGGPYWPPEQLQLFEQWMKDGFQP